jgi:thiol-disulfide isomerase/thioredoxin
VTIYRKWFPGASFAAGGHKTISGANKQTMSGVQPFTRRRILMGMVATLTGVAGPSRPADASDAGPPMLETAHHQFTILKPAKPFPSVRLTRLDGVIHDFALFEGKVVLVNFWASWCPACKVELTTLDRLQTSVRRKDLQVVAVSLDQGGRSTVLPFLRELSIKHLDIYLDPDGQIARRSYDENDKIPFPLYGMPMSYVIGSSGMVEGYMVGETDWLSDAARNLLGYYARAAQE